jgi:hypothetical protein
VFVGGKERHTSVAAGGRLPARVRKYRPRMRSPEQGTVPYPRSGRIGPAAVDRPWSPQPPSAEKPAVQALSKRLRRQIDQALLVGQRRSWPR